MFRVIRQLTASSWLRSCGVNTRCGIQSSRLYSDNKQELTPGEIKITAVLKEKFPAATFVNVSDISGGCGSMFEIQLETEEFRGKRTVLQHKMVTEALKAEIQEMHGLRISTAVPEKYS